MTSADLDMEIRAHPEDGDLLRYLDGECGPIEYVEVRRHVENCEECLKTLALFKGTSDRLGAALTELEAELPLGARETVLARSEDAGLRQARGERRFVRAHLARAAVVALALFGVSLMVSPVRAWLAERAAIVQEALFKKAVPSAQTPVAPVPRAPSTVSFVPAEGAFTIEVVAPQEAGELTLAITEGHAATAQVRGDALDEGLLVLPDRLRITNSSASTADYAVTLPGQLSEIRLTIGGQETLIVSTAGLELPARWSFTLDIDD